MLGVVVADLGDGMVAAAAAAEAATAVCAPTPRGVVTCELHPPSGIGHAMVEGGTCRKCAPGVRGSDAARSAGSDTSGEE